MGRSTFDGPQNSVGTLASAEQGRGEDGEHYMRAMEHAGIRTLTRLSALLYVFVVPWEKLILIPGLGTGLRIVGFIALGCASLSILIQGSVRPFHMVHTTLFVFAVYLAISALWAESVLFASVRSWTILLNFFIVLVIYEALDTRDDLLLAMKAYVFGGYVAVAGISYRAITGNVTQFPRRATLANTDENTVALVLAIGLPMAWYLATNADVARTVTKIERIALFAYIPAAYLGILLTASRGGAIGSLPFLVSIPFAIRSISRRQRGLALTGLGAVVVLAGWAAPETSWDRVLQSREQIATGDISSRLVLWQDGLAIWLESPINMLIGVGNGNYQFLVGKVSHNTPLAVLVEGGLIGVLIFAAVGWSLLSSIRRIPYGPRLLWLTAFAILAIGSLSLTLQWTKVTWTLFALAIAHVRLFEQQAHTRRTHARTLEPTVI